MNALLATTPVATSAPLLTIHLLAAAVWVGSLVALAIVSRAARETLDPPARVAFFRALGRRYGVVGGLALAVAVGTGAALLSGRAWTATLTVLAALTASLVIATCLGVIQARRVNRLRAREYRESRSESASVRAQARRADRLRAGIALLTLAIVVDAAIYVSGH